MAESGRSGASQDPLERYRQALRRQQSTGFEPGDAAEGPAAPDPQLATEDPLELDEPLLVEEPAASDPQLATEGPLELDEPLLVEEPAAPDKSRPATDPSYPPSGKQHREHIPDQSSVPAGVAGHEAQRAEAMLNHLAEQIRLGVDKPPLADKSRPATGPLDLDEPLAGEEPLELDEPVAAEEPLELGEPVAAEEPLDLGEPLAAEEPSKFDQSLEATETPTSSETRTAADWLGLDDTLAEEDPLELDDPHTLDATADHVASGAAADDDVPDELQDTLARYQMAMSKLRAQNAADTPDPPTDSGGPPEAPEAGTGGGSGPLNSHQRARLRQRDLEGGAAEPAPAQRVPRAAPSGSGDVGTDWSETEDVDELVREFPTRARVTRRARQRTRPASRAVSGWSTRAVTFAALLFAALPVQWLVYRQLGASFALEDLGAGLSALLPAALILLLARPASGKGQIVMVVGSAAVGLIGSAGFAYGLSLLQNQLPQGTSLVFGLLLSLGLFTAVWGPLFLILVPVLSRTSRPARSNS